MYYSLSHVCFADTSPGWGHACAGSLQLSVSAVKRIETFEKPNQIQDT